MIKYGEAVWKFSGIQKLTRTNYTLKGFAQMEERNLSGKVTNFDGFAKIVEK
jgi:hypothetical protein